MKTKEEKLNERNLIAATLGNNQVQEVLQKELEIVRSSMNTYFVTQADPHAYALHRLLGREEMLAYLINKGKRALEPIKTETKGQSK